MSRPLVAVLGGGANPEHEVSLASAAGIGQALTASGYRVERLTVERDGSWSDSAGERLMFSAAVDLLASCAVVFPAVHGPGERTARWPRCAIWPGCPMWAQA